MSKDENEWNGGEIPLSCPWRVPFIHMQRKITSLSLIYYILHIQYPLKSILVLLYISLFNTLSKTLSEIMASEEKRSVVKAVREVMPDQVN